MLRSEILYCWIASLTAGFADFVGLLCRCHVAQVCPINRFVQCGSLFHLPLFVECSVTCFTKEIISDSFSHIFFGHEIMKYCGSIRAQGLPNFSNMARIFLIYVSSRLVAFF